MKRKRENEKKINKYIYNERKSKEREEGERESKRGRERERGGCFVKIFRNTRGFCLIGMIGGYYQG